MFKILSLTFAIIKYLSLKDEDYKSLIEKIV